MSVTLSLFYIVSDNNLEVRKIPIYTFSKYKLLSLLYTNI